MKILKNLQKRIFLKLPTSVYCQLINFYTSMRGHELKIHPDENSPTIDIQVNDGNIKISRPNRYWNYKKGIRTRLDKLARQYAIDGLRFTKGDVLVDCGANIGEIGVWAKQFEVEYIAFEPEELEATCCDHNVFDDEKKTNRFALWKEKTTLKFYSKPDDADSSIWEMRNYDNVVEIETVTLSDFMKSYGKKKIRLFKLEAEGAEPEVLMGAKDLLPHIDYISADCGFERGIDQQSTFDEVNEILINNNFEIISGNLSRYAFLYKRRDCKA